MQQSNINGFNIYLIRSYPVEKMLKKFMKLSEKSNEKKVKSCKVRFYKLTQILILN